MKKNFFGIMMIGMILGTTTVFGKTNVKPGMNNRMNDRMEVRVNNHSNDPRMEMGRPGMDKPMPIPEHRHDFRGHEHRCHICGITEHEWHMMMDKGMHHNPTPKPMPKTSHFGR